MYWIAFDEAYDINIPVHAINILVSILLGTRSNCLLLDQFCNHCGTLIVHWIWFRENPFDKHTFVCFFLRFFSFSKHNLPKILMSYILKLSEWVRFADSFYTDSCGRVGDFTRGRISDLLLKKHISTESIDSLQRLLHITVIAVVSTLYRIRRHFWRKNTQQHVIKKYQSLWDWTEMILDPRT